MKVLIKTVNGAKNPEKQTDGSSGFDLYSAVTMTIQPNSCGIVNTGLYLQIPKGYEAQVRSRSGLALKKQVIVLNSPGTIDSDYRGQLGVILYNFGKECFDVLEGDRIAQLVFCAVPEVEFENVESVDSTERGSGGFGSTGV